jgi:hypothetical protein
MLVRYPPTRGGIAMARAKTSNQAMVPEEEAVLEVSILSRETILWVERLESKSDDFLPFVAKDCRDLIS